MLTPSKLTLFAATIALLALCASPALASSRSASSPALASAASSSPAAAAPTRVPDAAASATCVAQILRNGKLVALTTLTYRYKFVRIKGSKNFKKIIVRVKVSVRVSCAKQCVAVVKKRGKYVNVYSIKTIKVKLKKRGRIVTAKRRGRVYKFADCKTLPSPQELGTPVKITVLPGSSALLDFGSFQRQASVSGTLRGFVPGKIQLRSDIQINLTSGSLSLGQTPVFIDDACNNQVSASIRTGSPTTVSLDPTRQSTSTLLASGTVTAIAYTAIHLPLELRNEDTGCDKPYITTGYSNFTQTFFLRGRVGAGGLTKLTLTSPPDTLDVIACLAPGIPTQPCGGFQIPLPILVSTNLTVSVDLSGKG